MRSHKPSSQEVRDMLREGGEGERIEALAAMLEYPELGDFELLLDDGLERSRSAFEQYLSCTR